MPLHVPFRHELEGFTVFRSFSGEDDAALYHLHVGYFADEPRARQALEVVRRYYAFANIEPAPRTGMGSLDDTLAADFELLRSASARVVAGRNRPVPKPAPTPVQHFAVLLVRRAFRDDAPPIPRLPAFHGFSIYAVCASDDDGDCQDVRLGFFAHVALAQKFADSIRGHFPQAAVLPVSDRERARVTGLQSLGGVAVRPADERPAPGASRRAPRGASENRPSAPTYSW